MPRSALLTLLLALCACRADPEPDPHEAVLHRLDEIDARIAQLEAQLPAAPPPAAPSGIPEIATAPYDAKLPRQIRLHVRVEDVRFGDEVLPDAALAQRLEAAVRRHGDPTVLLRADPEIDQTRVEAVMDLVRRAGIRRLAIATATASGDTDTDPTTPR